jgi:hypothetical protein
MASALIEVDVFGPAATPGETLQERLSVMIRYHSGRPADCIRWLKLGNHRIIYGFDRVTNQNLIQIELNEYKPEINQKEDEMKSKEVQQPSLAELVRDNLMCAGIPHEAVVYIVKALWHTAELKSPTDQHQVTILNRRKIYEVVYSRDGAAVTCDAGDDFIFTLSDGTQMVGSVSTDSAHYIVKKKKKLSKEELLQKHARDFKVIVSTDEGECDVPFNFAVTDLGNEGIKLVVLANMEFLFKEGYLHSTSGPAYTSFNGTKYHYINGQPLTEEEFNNRILAGQGTWESIGV